MTARDSESRPVPMKRFWLVFAAFAWLIGMVAGWNAERSSAIATLQFTLDSCFGMLCAIYSRLHEAKP